MPIDPIAAALEQLLDEHRSDGDGGDRLVRAVIRHARGKLAGYKVPKSVAVVSELPRLGSGKADRRALAAMGAAPTLTPR